MHDSELIVGLDIGTTKVAAIVGDCGPDNVDIVGIGTHVSRGLRRGVVTHIEHTTESIKRAIEEAELMAGCSISTVVAGIAGTHVASTNSHGIVAIRGNEVDEEDLQRVIDAAKAVAIPMDREIIHVIPQDFIIDGQDGVRQPLGMSGVRLEARVHIVTVASASAQNILKCCERCDLHVSELVLQPLASATSVLSDEEREFGAILIDIGGGTTDVTVFREGAIVHSLILPVGGNHISNDISVGLRTPTSEAELIKCHWGNADRFAVDANELIQAPSVGGRPPRTLQRKILSDIISPRVEEIFELIRQNIDEHGYEDVLAKGTVLTGGGSHLKGISEVAARVLNSPIRCGQPEGVGGLRDVVCDPKFSTAVGLIQHTLIEHTIYKPHVRRGSGQFRDKVRDFFSRVF